MPGDIGALADKAAAFTPGTARTSSSTRSQ
jgi:hypothetical protein